MRVKEIMSFEPGCCAVNTPLPKVARMMVEYDCGAIPVVDDAMRLIGIVTDRDIACRVVAKGMDPSRMKAEDCMSHTVVAVTPETDAQTCCHLMEEHQVRRLPVVDKTGCCCGIVAQADIAEKMDEHYAAEVVKEISESSESESRFRSFA